MQEDYADAVVDIEKALDLGPATGIRYGFLAKIYARQQQDVLFYKNIELALENDYPTIELDKDPAFRPYKNQERFKELLESYQN